VPSAFRAFWANLALAVVAVVWGATFPVAKAILEVVPAFWYLVVRFAVASCVLWPLAWQHFPWTPGFWVRGGLAGLALAAGYSLQTLGLREVSATHAAFLTGLFVVLTPLFASLVGRRPGGWEWLGVSSGTAGLWLLVGGVSRLGLAEVLLLGCAAAFALHILWLDAAAREGPSLSLGALQVGVATAVLAGFAATEPFPSTVSPRVWAAVVGMGVVATAVAFLVQSWAQRFTPPAHVGLVFTVEPVAAALLARWWLAELLTPAQWVGAGLILAGIGVAQLRPGGAPAGMEAAAGR
jgi:drug/metabolite transporter (DMT)-like permease